MRVFVAGASGVIGRPLCAGLIAAGHDVAGTTRHDDRATTLKAEGIAPFVVDMFDSAAVAAAIADFRPDVIVNQLTDLSGGVDPERNAHIRKIGTRNLVDAAVAHGVGRLISQSVLWAFAPGPLPHREDAPLDKDADGARAMTVGGVVALETLTLETPNLRGTVLRYGHLYGPGTGTDAAPEPPGLHVEAAARAALAAIDRDAEGIFNVAEPSGYADVSRADTVLGNYRLD